MAKRPTITDVSSGFNSSQTLNENFQNLREGFGNTLSLDGSTPNSMGADLDLDSNDILNVDNLTVNGSIVYQGSILGTGEGGGGISGITIQDEGTTLTPTATTLNFTGTGVTVSGGTSTKTVNIPGGGGNVTEYSTVADLRTALAASAHVDGDIVSIYDTKFEVDSSLDDSPESWLYNVYNFPNYGLKPVQPLPLNLFFYSAFHDQNDNKMYQHVSADGLNWNVVNDYPIPRGTGNSTVGSRDQMPFWSEDRAEWLITHTEGFGQTPDYGLWIVNPTLEVWHNEDKTIGTGSGIRNTTLPGGTDVCEFIWGGKIFDFAGTKYLVFAAEYGADYTSVFGGNNNQFQPHIAEITDINTLATADPVRMDFPSGSFSATAPQSTKLPPDIIYDPATNLYWACVKDDYEKNILIYSNNTLTGTWTLNQTIDQDGGAATTYDSLEGPLWQVVRYRDPGTGVVSIKHRIMMSDNRDENNNLVERYVFVESDDGPGGTYGDIEELNFSIPTRNGGVINLAMLDDPRAIQSFQQFVTGFGGQGKDRMRIQDQIQDGDVIYPRQDVVYYFSGGGTKTITFEKTEATRFWISNNDFAGGNLVISNASGVGVSDEITANDNDVIEFRWNPSRNSGAGRYQRVGTPRSAGGGGGSADGVVTGGSFSGSSKEITLTRSESLANLTVDLGSLPYRFNGGTTVLQDSAGTDAWGIRSVAEDGNLIPFGGAKALGNAGNPVRELTLQPRAVDGTEGSADKKALFFAQNGALRLGTPDNTANNFGADVGHFTQWHSDTSTSGTVTWVRDEGNGVNLTASLSGTVTIDVSDLKTGEGVGIRVGAPNSQTVNLTLPSGASIEWAGGSAPTFGTDTVVIALERVGASNILGVWREFS